MAPWNLALRLVLELAALGGIATAAWRASDGTWRWLAAIGLPVLAMTVWVTFNVPGDPSRSGNAPVEVPGAARLCIELAILGLGAAGFLWQGPRWIGVALVVLLVVHYASSTDRTRWLLER